MQASKVGGSDSTRAGGGDGKPVSIYCTAFTLEDLCRVRGAVFHKGDPQFVRAADGAWRVATGAGGAQVHFDRLRDGTLLVDTTLEGRGWEDVKPLMDSKVEVDGETYRRYALFRAEAAAWSGDDDWRVVPAPTPRFPSRAMIRPCPPGRDSAADPRLFTVDPASLKVFCVCDVDSERVASACPTALTACVSRWVFDCVVLLPMPESILREWEVRAEDKWSDEHPDCSYRLPRITAFALMDADDAASCAADAVAIYDAVVELCEYDTLQDVAAHASADCLATVWTALQRQEGAGDCADAVLEAGDVLGELEEAHDASANHWYQ